MPVITRSQVTQSRASLSTADIRKSARTSPFVTARLSRPLTDRLSSALLNTWSNWFHAFYSEVEEEGSLVKAQPIFREAIRRWSLFAMRQHRVSSADILNWLGSQDARDLMDAFECGA